MNATKTRAQDAHSAPAEVDVNVLGTALKKEVEAAVLQSVGTMLKLAVHNAVEAGVTHSLEKVTKTKARNRPLEQTGGQSMGKRETRNGVTLPAPGGRCDVVWKALDAMTEKGKPATVQEIRKAAVKNGWNEHNSEIEFYRWRKFHGKEAAPASNLRRATDGVRELRRATDKAA